MIKRTKFNVSILGEMSVGKTCIVNSLKGMEFDENQIATIGVDDVIDEAVFDNQVYKCKIFDTAGQERYKSISSKTIQIADGFLIVFSVDNIKSFECLISWIQDIEEKVNRSEKIIILIGNKIDIEGEKRVIGNEKATAFAKKYKMKYFETSAKTGFRIKEAFHTLYEDIYELNKKLNKNENIKITGDDIQKKGDDKKDKGKGCC